MGHIQETCIEAYTEHLTAGNFSAHTVGRYVRDVRRFKEWLMRTEPSQSAAEAYIRRLSASYKPASVNSAVTSINSFSAFMGWEIHLSPPRCPPEAVPEAEKDLTGEEYARLLYAARRKEDERMSLILQTFYLTGIRVSELRGVTVEAVRSGRLTIKRNGKSRTVPVPKSLRDSLLQYAGRNGISSGDIFITQNGTPMNRTNIWGFMKKLCRLADVAEAKVTPDNLRRLRAREYCERYSDVLGLPELLGVSG